MLAAGAVNIPMGSLQGLRQFLMFRLPVDVANDLFESHQTPTERDPIVAQFLLQGILNPKS